MKLKSPAYICVGDYFVQTICFCFGIAFGGAAIGLRRADQRAKYGGAG